MDVRRPATHEELVHHTISRMQESPHVRFILPHQEMKRRIRKEQLQRKKMARMRNLPKWKRNYLETVDRVMAMETPMMEKEIKNLDATATIIYTRLEEGIDWGHVLAFVSPKIGPDFIRQAKTVLATRIFLCQVEQYREVFEMVHFIRTRPKADSHIESIFEKDIKRYAEEEEKYRSIIMNPRRFRSWAFAEFQRLKKA